MSARYAARGGDIVMSQPLDLSPTFMASWMVPADQHAMQRTLDAAFKTPSAGAVDIRPLAPMAMLVAAKIARGQSIPEPDHGKGWMPETDIGFWIPCARGQEKNGRFSIDALYWYQPYLFVDNVAALVTGRETFGFHKQSATCQMPTDDAHEARVAVTTLVIREFTPSSEGDVIELFRLVDPARERRGPLERLWHEVEGVADAAGDALEGLIADALADWVPSWAFVRNFITDLLCMNVPMVFLKQFRSIADPQLACFQAVTTAASKMTKWRGGGLLPAHELTVVPTDSHPIARDLGLAASPLRCPVGFWTEFDFVLESGETLWAA